MHNDYQIVNFLKYCEKCKHRDLKENETPCDECLNEPVNQHTEKPVKYEEKD